MKRLFAIALVLLLAAPMQSSIADNHDEQKAVLVTGASTGIGRAIAEMLAENGFYVYAGARKDKDLRELDRIDNVSSVRLDVTIQEEIDAAVEFVRSEGRGLYGIVNNAGVYTGGPVAVTPISELEWLMDVNLTGVYRVTKSFAPMIIESKGHINTISSISGVLSGWGFSQYSASKHAVEGFSDSLARELEPLGVTVSLIEPGNYNSKIGDTAMKRMADKYQIDESSPFYAGYRNLMGYLENPRSVFKEPTEVAEAALHAMTSDKPMRRYMVVPNEREARITITKALEEVAELNQWQAYQYSREQLIDMLDDALATRTNTTLALGAFVDDFLANTASEETHNRFWSSDLVYTSSNGTRFGKAQIMSGFEDEPDVAADWPTYSADDMQVRVYGDTGVVTFTLVGTPADDSDDPVMTYYNTGTFLMRDGAWRAIAWQATKTAE
ncbi:MAG: SDR family NAD(P)-dependent oxidoreductase [Pseudomonadota bacterium]